MPDLRTLCQPAKQGHSLGSQELRMLPADLAAAGVPFSGAHDAISVRQLPDVEE